MLFISQCKGTTHFHKKRKAKIEEVTVISSFYAICEKKSITRENIEDYIAVPDRYINSNKEYFANIAKGDSMIGKGINDGDTLIFEKTNVLESGQIGSFCINDGNDCVCKTFRRLNNGMIVLESANPKYDPIIIDVTNECFRVIGKLVCKFSGVE